MVKSHAILLASLLSLVLILGSLGACSSPSSAPSAKPSPTPTAAAWQPVWKDGKLQPLPDGFPNGPITLWNQWTPGHSDDVFNRVYANAAKDLSPVPIVNDTAGTAAGAGAIWGIVQKMKTLPRYKEGYHLAGAGVLSIPITYYTTQRHGATIADTKPIIITESHPNVLIAKADAPFNTIDELVAHTKANPGRVRYAGTIGTSSHVMTADLEKAAGIKFLLVPHDSASQALLTLIGGGVEITNIGINTAKPQLSPAVPNPKIKILAFLGADRHPAYPNIPTLVEQGYKVTPYDSGQGFFTHGDVPDSHVKWLFELLKKASEQPVYQDRVKQSGAAYKVRGPEEATAAVKDLAEKWGPLMKELGLTVEQK